MPTYILRRSPDVEEYLLWSTVVDAPVSGVMTRDEVLDWAAWGVPVDRDLAVEHARRRVARADEFGTSEQGTPLHGYPLERFWWREDAPETFGQPYEAEDAPGVFVGRWGTRDELFDACRDEASA